MIVGSSTVISTARSKSATARYLVGRPFAGRRQKRDTRKLGLEAKVSGNETPQATARRNRQGRGLRDGDASEAGKVHGHRDVRFAFARPPSRRAQRCGAVARQAPEATFR